MRVWTMLMDWWMIVWRIGEPDGTIDINDSAWECYDFVRVVTRDGRYTETSAMASKPSETVARQSVLVGDRSSAVTAELPYSLTLP